MPSYEILCFLGFEWKWSHGGCSGKWVRFPVRPCVEFWGWVMCTWESVILFSLLLYVWKHLQWKRSSLRYNSDASQTEGNLSFLRSFPGSLFCTCSTLSPHLCFSVPFRFLLPHCLSVPWDKIFVLVFTPDAQQSAWLAGVQYVFIELSGKSNSRMHQKYL